MGFRTTCLVSAGVLAVSGCGGQPSGAEPVTTNMETNAAGPVSSTVSNAVAPAVAATTAVVEAQAGVGKAPACPATISAGMTVATGVRVMGTLPAAPAALSYAALISGGPGDVRDDRVLAEDEPDETADETSDASAVHQVTATAQAPRSLACGYGMKPGFTEQGVLLIVPLPVDVALRCRIRLSSPGAIAGCAS